MAAAVPTNVIDNYKYDLDIFPEEEVKKVVDKIGVYERRFADENTCSSDLCHAAAEKLLVDNDIDRSEIDLLVFISQTPDKSTCWYSFLRRPTTACRPPPISCRSDCTCPCRAWRSMST